MDRREFNKILSIIPFLFSNQLNATQNINNTNDRVNKKFKFYNQLHFKNMPNINNVGFEPISFVYAGQMWPDKIKKQDLNIEFIFKKYKDKKLLGSDNLLCLDIEHWRVRRVSNRTFKKSVANFKEVIDVFRSLYPGVKIGIFEYAPLSFYPLYDQMASGKVEARHYDAWLEEMERVKIITDYVDVLFPQLYARWPGDPHGWEQCAREVMFHSRRIAEGRPVIPVVWPQYWLRDKSAPIIEGEYWATILKTIYEVADSVVFWSIYKTAPQWDSSADWWLETQRFIGNKKNI